MELGRGFRRITAYRHFVASVPLAAAALFFLVGTSVASAETRGYVISWFSVATNNPDFAADCPQTVKDQISRIGKRRVAKAFVNGKEVAALDYPDATPDPNIETVVGKYAYGFDLGGPEANKFIDPESHGKVDNQLWRAVGCTANFKFTPPTMPYLEGQAWQSGYADAAPAWAMQISGADLGHDGPVTVTLDRTLDHLRRDALGGMRSDVSYVLDPSPRSHNVLTGEIKNGVLWIKGGSMYLEGSLPFYSQIDLVNTHMMYTSRCVVADCVGQYHAVERLADYDPDPATGKNRKISITYRMEAVPAFLATEAGKVLATSSTAGLGGQMSRTVASSATAGGVTANTVH